MAAPTPHATRCPRCGAVGTAALRRGAAPSFHVCPHCGGPVVLVADRDPPPLYTWEVYANLYPSAPIPRGHPHRWGTPLLVLLLSCAVLSAGLSAGLGAVGIVTSFAGPINVAGQVLASSPDGAAPRPVPGASVHLAGDSGHGRSTLTDGSGRFRFGAVAVGGILLNVSYPGLSGAVLQLFDSPFYASSELADLRIVLGPSNGSGGLGHVDTNFPDLESFQTAVGTGAVLLAVGAFAAALSARASARGYRGVLVAAGGAGGALAPVATIALGLVPAMPGVSVAAGVAMALGGAAGGLAGTYRWLVGPLEGD